MSKEHEKYVEDLTKLANANAKASGEDALAILKKVGDLSNGNPKRFIMLLRGARKGLLGGVATNTAPRIDEARDLGKEFGATKV